MTPNVPPSDRRVRLIDAMDRPLLVLAIVTMGLYMLDLHGALGLGKSISGLIMVIDLIFVFDLALKLWTFGREYVQSPWFLIDLLSCLPVLDVLTGVFSVRAIRIVRAARILRVLRGLRIMRALRSIPAFERFVENHPNNDSTKRFRRFMNAGMVGLTVMILLTTVAIRRKMEHDYIRRIDTVLRDSSANPFLRALGGSLVKPPPGTDYVEREVMVGPGPRQVYFNLRPIEDRANQVEFFLILGMMFSMLLFMYVMGYHQLDVTQMQLRGLLNLALPKQVADQFVIDPNAYNKKSRMPATIVFMDFVGFTRTCEAMAEDPDKLSAHLEAAMDRLVGELVKHDMIIDKFIGDAIMSFRGGPLVVGSPADHAYRAVRASLDSIRALAALQDKYFDRVKIGGASADDCLIGAFGTSARLSYTILGDGVNLAARLEPASGQCGTRNLFCAETFRLCDGRADVTWRRWGRIRVAGKSAPLNVYEAFDAGEPEDLAFIATYHRALEAFERSDFDRARDIFLMGNAQREGGDEPSVGYAHWCEKLLLGGPPVGWEPVFETHK